MTLQCLKPKTQEYLLSLSRFLGCPGDRDKSKRILVAVFHALRDHLSFDQSLQVLSSLPVNLKSIYIYDWKMTEYPCESDSVSFVKSVVQRAGKFSHYDFSDQEKTLNYIRQVFEFMEINIPASKMEIIKAQYPEDLKQILKCA
ncbi:DUF2267 domain-containing protein [Cytophagaceae bacterium ABcell3]|nr:DUF2267 domain-containing protein [Cytophagaceae bacterium ABcell3]